jgi:hypothetical protein
MSGPSAFGSLNSFSGLQGFSSQSFGGAPSGGGALHSFNMSSSQHGPAIESLTLTAQSVGLSIEQLAAALSSSPNLKALSADSGNVASQRELALSLYRTESLAMYRRCMLLAGYAADAIEEQAPEYLQFAFRAWQEEGRRLQDLMGAEMSLQAPVVANLQQQQQEAAQAQAHAQVQAQVQAQAMQAQAQALALEQQQQQKQHLLLQNQNRNGQLKSLLYSGASSTNSTQLYSDAMQKRLTEMQLFNGSSGITGQFR